MLNNLAERPINLNFNKPDKSLIADLQTHNQCVEIIKQPGFIIGNDYYKQKLPGSIPRVFCRAAVLNRMQKLKQIVMTNYEIYFFDVFRTKATQAFLFNECQARLREKYPSFSLAELESETRKYVSHPDEPIRFTAPPHNTGGAIDLALVSRKDKKILNFGSPIDLSEKISDTDFFEKPFDPAMGLTEKAWFEARINRRILFNAMTDLGFTNYPSEWWHYDLGDGMWSQATGEETIFHSMEVAVQYELAKEECK